MIGNIHDCTSDETLTVYTNGGSKTFTHMSPFKFLPMEVNFNTDAMEKNLAIKDFYSMPGLRINMDSSKECEIIVEYQNKIIKFQEYRDGLYYYDTDNKFTSPINSYPYLSIVKDNKEYFSTSKIQGLDEDRKV